MNNYPSWYTKEIYSAARNFVARCVDLSELTDYALRQEGIVEPNEDSSEDECLGFSANLHRITERLCHDAVDAYVMSVAAEGIPVGDLERFFVTLYNLLEEEHRAA